MSEAEPTPPAPTPAPSKSKMLPLLLLVNTAFGGAALYLALRKPAPAPASGSAPAAAGHAPAGEHGAAGGAEAPKGEHGESAPEAPSRPRDDEGGPGPVVKLEGFVIQLRTADTDRYARVAFDIEIANENDRKAVSDRLSQIRDAIIMYFSDRTLDELRGSEGIERTKNALLKKFDELVPGRRIRSLFITDFVIQ
jgi:flagellar FliL protein